MRQLSTFGHSELLVQANDSIGDRVHAESMQILSENVQHSVQLSHLLIPASV